MNKFLLLILILIQSPLIAFSQLIEQNEFKPKENSFAKVFANFHTNIDHIESAFLLKRVYLGCKYSINEIWSAKATFDVGDPDDEGEFKYTTYAKITVLNYSKNNLSIDFDLIGMKQFKIQAKCWVHRYFRKCF